MSPNELQWLYDTARKVNSIVEIGSFMGKSTYALLSGCRGTVWAVDYFEFEPDVLNWPIRPIKSLKIDEIYPKFLNNVGHFKNLEVLKMLSVEAAKKFKDKSIDMVFIDASHDYESIKNDIESWLPKTKKLICGHDYKIEDPGVIRAVDEKFKDIETYDIIWFKWL